MSTRSVTEMVGELAKHPEGFASFFGRVGCEALLPLLQLPRQKVAVQLQQAFRDCGLSDSDFEIISLRDLLVFALRSASDHWCGLAVDWLKDGFPMDYALLPACREMLKQKRATRGHRHIVILLIKEFELGKSPRTEADFERMILNLSVPPCPATGTGREFDFFAFGNPDLELSLDESGFRFVQPPIMRAIPNFDCYSSNKIKREEALCLVKELENWTGKVRKGPIETVLREVFLGFDNINWEKCPWERLSLAIVELTEELRRFVLRAIDADRNIQIQGP